MTNIDPVIDIVQKHATKSWYGFRDTLLRAAYMLGLLIANDYLTIPNARKHLLNAIIASGYTPNDDDKRWINQGIEDGIEIGLLELRS